LRCLILSAKNLIISDRITSNRFKRLGSELLGHPVTEIRPNLIVTLLFYERQQVLIGDSSENDLVFADPFLKVSPSGTADLLAQGPGKQPAPQQGLI